MAHRSRVSGVYRSCHRVHVRTCEGHRIAALMENTQIRPSLDSCQSHPEFSDLTGFIL